MDHAEAGVARLVAEHEREDGAHHRLLSHEELCEREGPLLGAEAIEVLAGEDVLDLFVGLLAEVADLP